MAYAVIRTGGKQFRVKAGDVVNVPLIAAEPGANLEFQDVLAVGDDTGEVRVGTPTVSGVTVRGTVIKHGRDKKIVVFKMKRRKGYRRKQGHRQDFTSVLIESVG